MNDFLGEVKLSQINYLSSTQGCSKKRVSFAKMAATMASKCSTSFNALRVDSQRPPSARTAPSPACGRGRLQVVAKGWGLSDWFGGENYMASKIGNKIDLNTRDQPKGDGTIVQVRINRPHKSSDTHLVCDTHLGPCRTVLYSQKPAALLEKGVRTRPFPRQRLPHLMRFKLSK